MLYGIDDGAKTIDESVGMLKIAHEQGIEAVILTPTCVMECSHIRLIKSRNIIKS